MFMICSEGQEKSRYTLQEAQRLVASGGLDDV